MVSSSDTGKIGATSSSSSPAPPSPTAATTGEDLQRSLEEAKERAAQHSASIDGTLRRYDADTATAKSERRRLSCRITILSRDIQGLSTRLSGTVFEGDSPLEAQILEKQSQRRELQRQKTVCRQKMEYMEDEGHLLRMRKALVAKQMKRLDAHIASMERASRALEDKDALIRQTEDEARRARQVVEEKREYLCEAESIRQAETETGAAQQVLQERQGYLRQTEINTKAALDIVEAKREYLRQAEMSTKMAEQIMHEKQEYIRQREGDAAEALRDCETRRGHLDQTCRAARAQLDVLIQQLATWTTLPVSETGV
ncbi:hypothetical protein E4U42_007697 [Claviceps africana]|uniref:Uncharacterized protein n=1 Tax=Claviceps africana TaxID=83212 RepID=A0A8K0JEI1_9HYPO|nr:hypothetical protein E4U42_007697 [Claviceps africana]